MDRQHKLEKLVRDLYETRNDNRDPWADWLYATHIFVVADFATQLAQKHDVDGSLVYAAALLHDIADAVMPRHDQSHEEKSAEIARELLSQSVYEESEITIIVDDALRFHSCRDGNVPQTLEGKVMATADALAHLKTNFYLDAKTKRLAEGGTLPDFKKWVLEKIDRDFYTKIFFDDVRESVREDYEKLKQFFESL